jgi:hypothetical protein
VFGRQGYLRRTGRATAALGGDSTLSILVTPEIDTPLSKPVEHRLRAARTFRLDRRRPRGILTCSTRSTQHGARAREQRRAANVALVQNLSRGSSSVRLVVASSGVERRDAEGAEKIFSAFSAFNVFWLFRRKESLTQ